MELFQENVIVTANNFNVTLITQLWLVEVGVALRDEFLEGSTFSPAFVKFDTPGFQFLALQNQIQFQLKGSEDDKQRLVTERLGRFVTSLPHTPYTARGVNFLWHYRPDDPARIPEIGRRLFFKNNTPFAHLLESDDAKFGAYYSKDVLGFRLKLSTAPVDITPPSGQPGHEAIQLNFNYHRNAKNSKEISDSLLMWSEAKQHSQSLADAIEAAI